MGPPKYHTLIILGPMTTKSLSNRPPRTSFCSPKVPQDLHFDGFCNPRDSPGSHFAAQVPPSPPDTPSSSPSVLQSSSPPVLQSSSPQPSSPPDIQTSKRGPAAEASAFRYPPPPGFSQEPGVLKLHIVIKTSVLGPMPLPPAHPSYRIVPDFFHLGI